MQNFEITKEIVLSARDYLPLAEKEKIAEEIAGACLLRFGVSVKVGNVPVDLPDWNGTNNGKKARYLLGVLYKRYLGVEFVPVEGTEYLMSADDYDRAAATHPKNALERLKADKDAKNKCFDLLADYKELCDMCKAVMADMLAAQNDPVLRYLAANAMAITPDALSQLTEAERQLRKEVRNLKISGAEAQKAIRAHNEGIKAAVSK